MCACRRLSGYAAMIRSEWKEVFTPYLPGVRETLQEWAGVTVSVGLPPLHSQCHISVRLWWLYCPGCIFFVLLLIRLVYHISCIIFCTLMLRIKVVLLPSQQCNMSYGITAVDTHSNIQSLDSILRTGYCLWILTANY